MADVFGFEAQQGDNFFEKGDQSLITTAGGGVALIQDWQVQYEMQTQPIYECGSAKVYFAGKHGSGTFSCNRIYSGQNIVSLLGNLCAPKDVTLNAHTSMCKTTSNRRMILKGDFLNSLGYSGQAGNAFVSEAVGTMFVSLDIG